MVKYTENGAEKIKIAYIGGGSRGWAWGLMSDLATAPDMSGEVYLYDIDYSAALANEKIGNKFNELPDAKAKWIYKASETIGEALSGADFVVISILPGTFREMEGDVHLPEKYGIWQSVGDTTGPGGIIRSLRTIPMMEEIARAVEKYAPGAWVINYTNPMAQCVKALYRAFPKIKAFGCCHEVFATQKLLTQALYEVEGISVPDRRDIDVEVYGVNHFTWIESASYRGQDVFPIYEKYVKRFADGGNGFKDNNWMNKVFACTNKVKFDLFLRYGKIAAAGDRHLAEFCPAAWYLDSPECVEAFGFSLTPVSWRWKDLENRLLRSKRLQSGEETVKIEPTGEEGVIQMRALLGLGDYYTNVNLPNVGQMSDVPLGAVVETNAYFAKDSVKPASVPALPNGIRSLVGRNIDEQIIVAEAAEKRNLDIAFSAFMMDPLTRVNISDGRKLFDEMVSATAEYLKEYLN